MTRLSNAWAAHWAISMYGITKRRKQGFNLAAWLLLLLTLLASMTAAMPGMSWQKAVAIAAGPLFVLVLLWWGSMQSGIAEQRKGMAALVPGLIQRSQRVSLGAFGAVTLLFSALYALHFGATLVPAMVIVGLLSLVGIAAISPIVFLAVFLGSLTSLPVIGARVGAVWIPTLLMLSWCYLVFRGRHSVFAAHALEGRLAHYFEGANRIPARGLGSPARLAERGAIGALLMRATGPHGLVVALAVGGCIGFWSLPARYPLVVDLLIYATAGLQVAAAFWLRSRLAVRRDEQALVRLAPRAPSTSAFNAVLGRELARQFIFAWAGLSLVGLGRLYMLAEGTSFVVKLTILSLLTLPAAVLFLRGHAKPFSTSAKLAFVPWIGIMLWLPAWVANQSGDRQLLAGAIVLSSVVTLCIYTMSRMRTAPILFPAGRIG